MNETAQKILGYIKRLPKTWDGQPLRQQALDNFDENFCEAEYGHLSEIDFIGYAFNWHKTLEKKPYWQEVYTLIKDGTIQLLPEVEEKKNEFVWTDELALEFSVSPYSTISPLRNGLEQFKASKQRKPLFVTEDGVDVFEDGAELICVEKDFSTRKAYISPFASPIKCNKYFSTEAAANEYVRLNRPMYSLNDVKMTWVEITGVFNLEVFIKELEKLKQ